MSEYPKISVVIPLYNKERHIARAIDSVLSQKYSPCEIIVVNDASTDNGRSVVLNYKDSRVVLLDRALPGPGGYAARNLAINSSKGDYIAFLDADDEWSEDHLSSFVEYLSENPHICFFGAAYYIVDELGNKKLSTRAKLHRGSNLQILNFDQFLKSIIDNMQAIWTSSTIIELETLKSSGLFPDGKTKRGGDTDTWLRTAWLSGKIYWSSKPTATYYKDSDNRVTRTGKNFEPFNIIDNTCDQIMSQSPDALTRRYLSKLKGKKFYELAMARKKYSGKIFYSFPALELQHFISYPKSILIFIPDFIYRMLFKLFKR